MEEIEIWKDIPGYEGYYQVSSLGAVRSLERKSNFNNMIHKGITMRPRIDHHGYMLVKLSRCNIGKNINIHRLVAMAFLGHTPCGHEVVVNHINGDKTDNRLFNLELVTNRHNCTFCHRKDGDRVTSKHPGVYYDKSRNKWAAGIQIDGKQKHLGRFLKEEYAARAYLLEYNKTLIH